MSTLERVLEPAINRVPRQLYCYRLTYRVNYDEEAIWSYVQGAGGHISIRQDCIDFWVSESARVFLVIRWPLLEAQPDRDYI